MAAQSWPLAMPLGRPDADGVFMGQAGFAFRRVSGLASDWTCCNLYRYLPSLLASHGKRRFRDFVQSKGATGKGRLPQMRLAESRRDARVTPVFI